MHAAVASWYSRKSASAGTLVPVSKTRLCPFRPKTRGQRQPCRSQDRPRAHGDDHGVALERLAVDLDASHALPPASRTQARDAPEPQLGAAAPRAARIMAAVNWRG